MAYSFSLLVVAEPLFIEPQSMHKKVQVQRDEQYKRKRDEEQRRSNQEH
jgi:heme exporter protein D